LILFLSQDGFVAGQHPHTEAAHCHKVEIV
jgi:hypothetical protein